MTSGTTKTTILRPIGRPFQLHLLEGETAWRIDEQTKRIGREGIAKARAALAACATDEAFVHRLTVDSGGPATLADRLPLPALAA